MKQQKFKKMVCRHLSQYNKSGKGFYKGKEYDYILKCEETKDSRVKVIKEYALLDNVKRKSFFYDGNEHGKQNAIKLHPYAHHLNSSQIMCYNFFRPLINEDSTPQKELVNLFRNWCPTLDDCPDSLAQFEYQEKGERTNFDFYIRSGSTEIFCEIKYTEQDFGSHCAASSSTHFTDIYVPKIQKCSHIWRKKIDRKDFMEKYFQLFRNALRADETNKFVFFICPKDREDLKESFSSFRNEYIREDCKNIFYVTWEELMTIAQKENIEIIEFKERYFGF